MTNDSLAVKWDDLMSYRKTKTPERDDFVFYKVEGTAPNRQLIIQWNNYGIYQSVQEFGTMQAILYEGSNNIQFYYISLLTPGRSDGASGTVGIKSAAGVQTIHSHMQAVLTQGESICWIETAGSYTKMVGTSPECLHPGSPLTNQSTPPPGTPKGLARTNTTFSWNAAADATSYRLVISTNSNLNAPVCDLTVTSTSKDASACLTIVNGQTCFWAVQAINSVGANFSDTQNFSSIPPVADTYSIHKNGTLTASLANGVLANDSGTLTAVKLSDPVHSTSFTFNADGTFSYTPDTNYNGPDSFSYIASDGHLVSSAGTVALAVKASNDAPVASDDAYSVGEDGFLKVPAAGVLTNDHDVDGNILRVTGIGSSVINGVLQMSLDGGFTYKPNSGFSGTDSFTYKVNDVLVDSNEVTITVNHVNHPTLPNSDAYTIAQDGLLTVPVAQGLLANDLDIDADVLLALIVTQPQNGTLQLNQNGSFKYTPTPGYAGLDNFSYKAKDSLLDSNIATVVIDVHFTNRPPVATDDAYSVAQDTLLPVNVANGLLSNDTDPDANTLQPLIVTQPASGVVHVLADGSFSYLPATGFTRSDSFTYKVNDGNADSNTATVSISVNTVNHPPIAKSSSYTVTQGVPLQVNAPGILTGASDPDGDQFTARIITPPATGSIHLNHDGSFTYTAPRPTIRSRRAAPVTQVNFIFVASDGNLSSASTVITIDILAAPSTTPVKPIPTLSQWAVILLSMLMLIVAGRFRSLTT